MISSRPSNALSSISKEEFPNLDLRSDAGGVIEVELTSKEINRKGRMSWKVSRIFWL